jgi:hypothetical protein
MRQLKYLERSLALSFPSWKEFVKIGKSLRVRRNFQARVKQLTLKS